MSMRLGPRQGFPGGRVVESPPAKAGDAGGWGSITGQEDPPEEGMATRSSILPRESHGQKSLGGPVHGAAKSRARLKRLSTALEPPGPPRACQPLSTPGNTSYPTPAPTRPCP